MESDFIIVALLYMSNLNSVFEVIMEPVFFDYGRTFFSYGYRYDIADCNYLRGGIITVERIQAILNYL